MENVIKLFEKLIKEGSITINASMKGNCIISFAGPFLVVASGENFTETAKHFIEKYNKLMDKKIKLAQKDIEKYKDAKV